MNNEKKQPEQPDIWTVIFNGLAEAVKMLFSIFMAVVVASSKPTNAVKTSTDDKTPHVGDRHNNDKSVHYDNDA